MVLDGWSNRGKKINDKKNRASNVSIHDAKGRSWKVLRNDYFLRHLHISLPLSFTMYLIIWLWYVWSFLIITKFHTRTWKKGKDYRSMQGKTGILRVTTRAKTSTCAGLPHVSGGSLVLFSKKVRQCCIGRGVEKSGEILLAFISLL